MVMVRSWNTLCGVGWEGGYHVIILGIQPWTTDVVFTESMLNIPKYFYRPYPTLHTMCVIVRMRYLLVD